MKKVILSYHPIDRWEIIEWLHEHVGTYRGPRVSGGYLGDDWELYGTTSGPDYAIEWHLTFWNNDDATMFKLRWL